MNKFLKWSVIVSAVIVTILLIMVLTFALHYDRYGFYSSGGPISPDQAAYDVHYYELNLKFNPEDQFISGNVEVILSDLSDSLSRIELDLIDNYDVEKVEDQDGKVIDFDHDNDKLWLYLDTPLKKAEVAGYRIYYSGHPIEAIWPPWVDGFVWSKDSSGKDWIGVTCQGEGAKIWFPCKNHPSDKPDSAAINISVPEGLYCASNGLLMKESTIENGYQTFYWKTHYPINNYNINPSIGNYRIKEIPYYSEDRSIVMPVRFYYLPHSENKAEKHLEMARDMLYTYRQFYGEYPWIKEKFAIVETDYLGMEHQSINAYGNKFHYRKMSNGEEYDWLMLHEMGHEWWGNKVTVKDWSDFWIQEGICTYGEALYLMAKAGEGEYRRHIDQIRSHIKNEAPIIPKKNATSSESYMTDIYYKGALFMHSLRFVLGDSVFFKTLKGFATDPRFTYLNEVTTEDLQNYVKEVSGKDLSRYFDFYLYTTNLIHVVVDSLPDKNYGISIPNIDFTLPMEIQTNDSLIIRDISIDAIKVKSLDRPVVDPNNWYLKQGFKNKKRKKKNA